MPWIPLYADDTDFCSILGWLNEREDLAYIVSDGPSRWRAVRELPAFNTTRVCLWHVPSGSLPLLQANQETGAIQNPWEGWQELRAGADTTQPYFGAGHPGVIWLNIRSQSKRIPKGIGLSSFEWIGNHYKCIGNPAQISTERFWPVLRRWVQKNSKKIPRTGPLDGPRPQIFAFNSALSAFEGGAGRDLNP